MNGRMKYEIPGPPDDSRVFDMDGNLYLRIDVDGEHWFNDDSPAVRGTYTWTDLLFRRGPLETR